MLLPRALLAPHLPTLLLDEHRRHDTPMLTAMRLEAERLWGQKPEVLVVVSARGESTGPFQVGAGRAHRSLTGDPAFGVEVRYDCPGHPRLARALVEAGVRSRLRVGATPRGIDGGVSVPLHFLLPARNVPVVPIGVSDRPEPECRAFGAVVRQVLESWPERVGLVVGGMLSHATHAWHFRREVPESTRLDQHVLATLAEGRWEDLMEVDPRVVERAQPEAGLRHLALLRGFLDADVHGEVLCYEAGPGMGAALVAFDVPGGVEIPLEERPVFAIAAPPPARSRPPSRQARPQGIDRRRPPIPRPGPGSRTGPRPGSGSRTGPRPGSGSRTGPRPGSGSRTGPRPGSGSRSGRPASAADSRSGRARPALGSRTDRPGLDPRSRGGRPGADSRARRSGPRLDPRSPGGKPGSDSRARRSGPGLDPRSRGGGPGADSRAGRSRPRLDPRSPGGRPGSGTGSPGRRPGSGSPVPTSGSRSGRAPTRPFSAGSRTPRAPRPARASRPARKPPD